MLENHLASWIDTEISMMRNVTSTLPRDRNPYGAWRNLEVTIIVGMS